MDEVGSMYFTIPGTKEKLYFGTENKKFVCYSFSGKYELKYFFYAIPKMPLTDENGLQWKENLPDNLFASESGLHLFFRSFKHNKKNAFGVYKITGNYEIEGRIDKADISTKLTFDKTKGFKELFVKIKNDEFVLKRTGSSEE